MRVVDLQYSNVMCVFRCLVVHAWSTHDCYPSRGVICWFHSADAGLWLSRLCAAAVKVRLAAEPVWSFAGNSMSFHCVYRTLVLLMRLGWVELSWVWIFVYGAELADQSQRRRTMVHGCWKSWVFSRHLKVFSDSLGVRSEGGRLFQVVGPNTAKLRWPGRSELWAGEEFQSSQSIVDAFPRLKWPGSKIKAIFHTFLPMWKLGRDEQNIWVEFFVQHLGTDHFWWGAAEPSWRLAVCWPKQFGVKHKGLKGLPTVAVQP